MGKAQILGVAEHLDRAQFADPTGNGRWGDSLVGRPGVGASNGSWIGTRAPVRDRRPPLRHARKRRGAGPILGIAGTPFKRALSAGAGRISARLGCRPKCLGQGPRNRELVRRYLASTKGCTKLSSGGGLKEPRQIAPGHTQLPSTGLGVRLIKAGRRDRWRCGVRSAAFRVPTALNKRTRGLPRSSPSKWAIADCLDHLSR